MTLRMPQSLTPGRMVETGFNVLEHEIAQQKAQTLGGMGEQVEKAMARLREFDAAPPERDAAARREALLDDAAHKVWSLMVQRELCGLRHWDAVVRSYGIPREVLNRMGRSSPR